MRRDNLRVEALFYFLRRRKLRAIKREKDIVVKDGKGKEHSFNVVNFKVRLNFAGCV